MNNSKNLQHYAHILDGVVVNVSVWDGSSAYNPGDGVTMVPLPYEINEEGDVLHTAGIGWSYVNNEFVDNRPNEND